MKKKLLVMLALVLSISMLAVACGNNQGTTEIEKQTTEPATTDDSAAASEAEEQPMAEEMNVEVVAKGFQHQFWKAVLQGAEQAAADNNAKVNFVGPPSEEDIEVQVQQLNDALAAKPAAICLAALSTEAVKAQLEEAMAAGIPVIGFDSGVPDAPEGSIVATASTDNMAAGALAAENLYSIIEAKIKEATPESPVRIGVISQEVNSESVVGRTQGFLDKMIELVGADMVRIEGHDKFNNDVADATVILDVGIPAKIDDASGQATAESIMEKDDTIAMYGSNEFAANALINANDAQGGKLGKLEDGKIVGVGFDAGAKQKEAVKTGVLVGSITQDPVQIGYKSVEMALAAAKGEPVEDVDTGARWYTAENMEMEEFAPLLYD